jgi:hypothetical protein
MIKLSDSQRMILSAAAQHEMGLAHAPKTLPAAARNAVFRSLIKTNLLTEINAPREHLGLGWRQDEDGTWIVARITDEGLRAIGIDPNGCDAQEEDEQSAEAIARRNAERRAGARQGAHGRGGRRRGECPRGGRRTLTSPNRVVRAEFQWAIAAGPPPELICDLSIGAVSGAGGRYPSDECGRIRL